MARGPINPNKSELKETALNSIQPWLMGEDTYQFHKNFFTHRGNPSESRDHILEYEVKNKWSRFQFFRRHSLPNPQDLTLKRHVGQNVLKACAAARAAFVWDRVEHGDLLDTAQHKSWRELHKYLEHVEDSKVPLPAYDQLKMGIPDVVDAQFGKTNAYQKPFCAFIGMVGLSLTAVIEQSELTSGNKQLRWLPQPGVESGVLLDWNY